GSPGIGRAAVSDRRDWSLTRRAMLLAGGAAVLAGCAGGGIASTPATGGSATASRLQDIRSVREIKRLQHLWGHYADVGQWAEMATLFSPGGVWTDGSRTVSGQAAIGAFLRETMGGGGERLPPGRLNLRLFLTPVITLA